MHLLLQRSLVVLLLPLLSGLIASCGPEGGEEPETPLEYGFEKREAQSCESSPILDALLRVCNYYAECTREEVCSKVTQELFTGTTLQPVENPSATFWNEFGGRGEMIADAGICMLKDLSRRRVENTANARLFEVFPTDFIESCVSSPVPDQPKPESSFVPGTGEILEMTQFPCNVCVAYFGQSEGNISTNGSANVVTPSTAPTAGPRDWSCNAYHSGCFDLCQYNPSNGSLTVKKTAVQMGLRGGTATGANGWACGENPPR